jgi:hypothetical protein
MKFVTAFFLMACASPALAIDSCLVGVWEADGADLAHVMGSQMPSGSSVQHLSGRVSLEITNDGTMTLLAEDFTILSTMAEMPGTAITIAGYSQGAMNADDGTNYVANAPEYSLIGSADVLGQRLEMSAAELSGGAWGQSTGTYGCSGNSVSFEANRLGSIPRRWRRIR